MDGTPNPTRSGEVDALRGLALLSVMALHAGLLPLGWIGVWLFYVISGFVVTLSVLRRRPRDDRPAPLGPYLRRRVARIVPLYLAYLALGLGVATLLGYRQDGLSLASLLLFLDNAALIAGLGHVAGWPSGHLWTLSVEMQFYVVFGAALCLLPRRYMVPLLAALIIACPLARAALGLWLAGDHWSPLDAAYAVYVAPGLHFDIFAMGALLAFAQADGSLKSLARPLALSGAAVLLFYVASYIAINRIAGQASGLDALRNILSGILFGESREALVYSAVGFAMTGLVALAAARDPLLQPLLGLRPLQRIGEISYGGYILQHLGLWAAAILLAGAGFGAGLVPLLLHYALGIALTLLAAEASFRWFETPCRHWIETVQLRRIATPTFERLAR